MKTVKITPSMPILDQLAIPDLPPLASSTTLSMQVEELDFGYLFPPEPGEW
jgi:hypothetical protein